MIGVVSAKRAIGSATNSGPLDGEGVTGNRLANETRPAHGRSYALLATHAYRYDWSAPRPHILDAVRLDRSPTQPIMPLIGAVQLKAVAADGARAENATGSILVDDPESPLPQRCMLVTALHVLTGVDPYHPDLSSETWVPAQLALRVLSRSESDPETRALSLYDGSGRGLWLEADRGGYDIAAIDVTNLIAGTSAPSVDLFNDRSARHLSLGPFLEADVRVGDHLVLAAFPYGRQALELFPLTLQALLATDLDSMIRVAPEVAYESDAGSHTPGFYIDCAAAAPGCDGGLVYLYERSWRTRSGFTVGLGYRAPIPLGMYIGRVDGSSTLGRTLPLSAVTDVAFHGRRTQTSRA